MREDHLNKKLFKAAETGNLEEVEDLLDKGADVSTVNNIGYNPLHYAAMRGHTKVVEFLLSKGVDVDMAIMEDDTLFLKYAPLHCATKYGHVSVVKFLLDKDANKNMAVTNRKLTPLHLAIESITIKDESNRYGVVKLLLNKGAEIDSRSAEGKTPLFYAAWLGCAEIVESLLNRGANVSIASNRGVTPLGIAREMRFNSKIPLRGEGCVKYDNVIKLLEKRYNITSIPNNENWSHNATLPAEESKKVKEIFSAIAGIFCCSCKAEPRSLLNDCKQPSYGSYVVR